MTATNGKLCWPDLVTIGPPSMENSQRSFFRGQASGLLSSKIRPAVSSTAHPTFRIKDSGKLRGAALQRSRATPRNEARHRIAANVGAAVFVQNLCSFAPAEPTELSAIISRHKAQVCPNASLNIKPNHPPRWFLTLIAPRQKCGLRGPLPSHYWLTLNACFMSNILL